MALAAMFVALMVGAGWALALVPNIEFVTAIAFTAGATLGPLLGAATGATGEFFFSAANPIGSGLASPVLLLSQIVGMAAVALLGGAFSKVKATTLQHLPGRAALAVAGLLGTILFDGLTSISFPLFAGFSWAEIIAVLIAGLAFTLIHQVANTLIFFLIVPRLIKVSRASSSLQP